ncbi:DUF6443 domain-containing protein [Mucilaginibacter sp. 22184]|uniref:DUF6443 domain-containing protein n=1 Tax=Mucilaginibacter sp. 22184 TaxID=3453887 RepID=UPI003F86B82D
MIIKLSDQVRLRIILLIAMWGGLTVRVFAQSLTYIQEDIIKKAGVTEAQIFSLSATDKQTTTTYYDGMGRPVQTVALKASPNQKDIIQPVIYNNLGQQTKSLLPYVGTDGSGSYRPNAVVTEQPAFYNNGNTDKVADDSSPFSQQVFENSPLQRTLRSGMVGAGFQPTGATGTQHYKTISYRTNSNTADGNIIMWGPDGSNTGNYTDNALSVTDGADEDGVETISFSNLQGQTVLKRQKNGSGNLDTYYVYNNGGMISYVIPPLALKTMVTNGNYDPNQAVVSKLVFKYVYDRHGRLAERTQPGAGVVYMVYDTLSRPVLIQDAKLRASNQWNYIKYDAKDHAISQGIYTDATNTTRAAMQNYVSTTIAANYNTTWYESRSTAAATGYYTNAVFPTANITPLAYSYYDDYDLDGNGTADYTYNVQSLSGESTPTTAAIKGIPTMVRLRTVGTGAGINNIWLIKVMFYDKNGHTIQTQSNNQLNYTAEKVSDYTTSAPDFMGKPLQTKMVKTTGTTVAPVATSVQTTMTYDHMYRVIAVDQSYNGGTAVHVASYNYNELGQLVQKNLQPGTAASVQDVTLNGSNSVASGATLNVTAGNSITMTDGFLAANGSTFTASISPGALQSIDYRYNIRGQLTSINNSKLTNDSGTANMNDDSNDLFGMQLLYDQADSSLGNTPWFNGKQSAVKWMSKDANGTQSNERSYIYSYDALNRYTGSTYAERTASSTGAFNVNVNGFNENAISYDAGGNLLTLKRNSIPTGGRTATEFDNLTYTYDPTNPNQLKSVTDGTGSNYTAYGFRNLSGTTSGTYTYDVNGNLTADPYKALTLDYNILNRTDKITITSATGRYIAYTYDATGQLIRKQQFDNNSLQTTTDYIDGLVYLNGTLSYLNMPEGRLRNTGTGSTVTLKREYIISDQQGNARISLEESATTPGTAIVRQENSYYGFGLVMPGSPVATPTIDNKQLYNGGSEWQRDFGNLPDYYQTFYRNYDAALGRFVGVDPQPESAESLTGYNYSGNNPIMYNDPLGDKYYQKYAPVGYGGAGGGGTWDPGQMHSNHWLNNDFIGNVMNDWQMSIDIAAGNDNAIDQYIQQNGTQIYNTNNKNNPLSNSSIAALLNGKASFNMMSNDATTSYSIITNNAEYSNYGNYRGEVNVLDFGVIKQGNGASQGGDCCKTGPNTNSDGSQYIDYARLISGGISAGNVLLNKSALSSLPKWFVGNYGRAIVTPGAKDFTSVLSIQFRRIGWQYGGRIVGTAANAVYIGTTVYENVSYEKDIIQGKQNFDQVQSHYDNVTVSPMFWLYKRIEPWLINLGK